MAQCKLGWSIQMNKFLNLKQPVLSPCLLLIVGRNVISKQENSRTVMVDGSFSTFGTVSKCEKGLVTSLRHHWDALFEQMKSLWLSPWILKCPSQSFHSAFPSQLDEVALSGYSLLLPGVIICLTGGTKETGPRPWTEASEIMNQKGLLFLLSEFSEGFLPAAIERWLTDCCILLVTYT